MFNKKEATYKGYLFNLVLNDVVVCKWVDDEGKVRLEVTSTAREPLYDDFNAIEFENDEGFFNLLTQVCGDDKGSYVADIFSLNCVVDHLRKDPSDT